jgi:hypothetical protein
MPSSVTLKNAQADVIINKTTQIIPVDKKSNEYIGVLPDGRKIGITPKKSAVFVTVIDADNKKYKTSIYRLSSLSLPEKGKYYVPAPDKDNFFVSSPHFIASYPFWTGDQTARAYDVLSYKERGIIRMFPYISAEIAHKLCVSHQTTSGLFQILDGQDMDCKSLKSHFETLLQSKKLSAFQASAQKERVLLGRIFECEQGLLPTKQCQNVSKDLGNRALNVHNIASIFQ